MSLPDGIEPFLEHAGWQGAEIVPLEGDASFRRYFRIRAGNADRAMLMYAPPPHEDPVPFLDVARWLDDNGLRPPKILADDAAQGFVLLEDFGDARLRDHLDGHPEDEMSLYGTAVDTLAQLHRVPAGPFDPYDMAVYLREVNLLPEWYAPLAGLEVNGDSWEHAWQLVLEPLVSDDAPRVTVLRDYHAENIMLPPDGTQGLIDFQDALVGHPAYDLVSLLQDARRDVSPELEAQMLERYRAAAEPGPDFDAAYALLGAQRNAKIVGIFARLYKRDGKPRYLAMIPRVWAAMERDLQHPALGPVADWFAANIPDEVRRAGGGELA